MVNRVKQHRDEEIERAGDIAGRLGNNWVTGDPQENDRSQWCRVERVLGGRVIAGENQSTDCCEHELRF